MANTLTNLTTTIVSRAALQAFTATLTALTAFATNCSADAMERGDTVKVLFVNAASAASDFAGTYTVQDSTATGLDVSINKHKFVSWGLTDKEIADRPQLEVERFGRQKGFQLAKAVLQDIWSSFTIVNYGAAAFTGAASTFDADDVVDLGSTCDDADWPEMDRALILRPAYHSALRKDNQLQNAQAFGSADVVRRGMIPSLDTFQQLFKSSLIPANAINLVGMAVLADSLLVAMRYLSPQDGNDYLRAEPLSDPETGFTTGLRQWYDRDSGQMRVAQECNYGYRVGNGSAAKLLVSA